MSEAWRATSVWVDGHPLEFWPVGGALMLAILVESKRRGWW